MAQLVQYLLATGQIAGIWSASPASALQAQIVPDDPTYGYYLTEDPLPAAALLQQGWEVVAEALTAKSEAVLTPDVTTFAADGIETCTITVVPFVACALTVNGGEPVALTGGDPTLVLTSDVPAVFTMALVPMAGVWAESITVEAV